MSERESWMPSRETFLSVVYGLDPMKPEETFGQDTEAVGNLLRAAVEKALAEQREAMALDVDLAKMCAERLAEELRVLRLIIQSDKVQRRREVIEAKIAAYEYAAWNTREAPFTSTLQALAAELAALEGKP